MRPAYVDLSIILPAYNEALRLVATLHELGEFLARRTGSSEIVLVDDGSTDGTFELARGIASELGVPMHGVRYAENRGKGHALKVGFAVARGDRLLSTDCDLSTPLAEVDPFLAAIDEGYDLAIGSRKMAGAEIRRHQPWLRENLGRLFTQIVRWTIADVTDVTCGFKAYRGDVGRDLFSRLRIDAWAFDAEMLLLARKDGYRLRELPVRWAHRDGSKVNLWRDVIGSAADLLRIHWSHLRGRYAGPGSAARWEAEWSTSPDSSERAPGCALGTRERTLGPKPSAAIS